jgi:hypothetical protein
VTAESLLWAMLGASGFHVFRLGDWEGRTVHLWRPVSDRARFVGTIRAHGWASDLAMCARPYSDRGSFRLEAPVSAVWARTETRRQVSALSAFPVEPTLVLREGGTCRHTAFWALRKPLDPDDSRKVCKHLAHALRTPKKYGDCLWFAPPGCVIREKARPVPVVVAHKSEELYSMRRLARHLPRTIPNADAWRGVAAR